MKFRALVAASVVVFCSVSTALAGNIKFGTALAPTQSSARGTGWGSIEFNLDTRSMLMRAGFSGMSGNSTAATLNGPTAVSTTGTADPMLALPSLTGFPLGVKHGTYERTFDMNLPSNYNPAFLNSAANLGDVSLAFDSLVNALTNSKAYLNIESTQFAGGELRGFYKVVPPVPEPASLAGLLGVVLALPRRR